MQGAHSKTSPPSHMGERQAVGPVVGTGKIIAAQRRQVILCMASLATTHQIETSFPGR